MSRIADRDWERDRQRSLFRPIPDAEDRWITGVTDSEYERFLRLRAENPSDPVPRTARPEWDAYFFGIAEAASRRADCTRRQVGCVLVGPDHRVLSTGYNGAPAGIPGCATAGACPRGRQSLEDVPTRTSYADGQGACIALHAEVNAVMYCRPKSREGATAYVTVEPCPQCYAVLAAAGITDVRWPPGTD